MARCKRGRQKIGIRKKCYWKKRELETKVNVEEEFRTTLEGMVSSDYKHDALFENTQELSSHLTGEQDHQFGPKNSDSLQTVSHSETEDVVSKALMLPIIFEECETEDNSKHDPLSSSSQDMPEADLRDDLFFNADASIPEALSFEYVDLDDARKKIPELDFVTVFNNLFTHIQCSLPGTNWHVINAGNGIQVFKTTPGPNIAVNRSIFIHKNRNIDIFIRNIPLPKDNKMWISVKDLSSLDMVTDIDSWKIGMTNVMFDLARTAVCPGNFEETYSYLWREDSYVKYGRIELYLDRPSNFPFTFRVKDCALVAKKTKCKNCYAFKKLLQKTHSRERKRETSSTTSCGLHRPHSAMSEKDLKVKLTTYATKVKMLKSQVRYRDEKIKKMNKDEGVEVNVDSGKAI